MWWQAHLVAGKKKPGEELSQQEINAGRGPALGGQPLTASLPAWGGRGLLTADAAGGAHVLGRGLAGAVDSGELPELSPELWNQAGLSVRG